MRETTPLWGGSFFLNTLFNREVLTDLLFFSTIVRSSAPPSVMTSSKDQLIKKLLFHLFDEYDHDPNVLEQMYNSGFYNNLAYDDIWDKLNIIAGDVVCDH